MIPTYRLREIEQAIGWPQSESTPAVFRKVLERGLVDKYKAAFETPPGVAAFEVDIVLAVCGNEHDVLTDACDAMVALFRARP